MQYNAKKERMLELLADQVMFGLSTEETKELEMLLEEFPEFKSDHSFENAAAAISLSNLKISEEMPQNLQAKILADADEFFMKKPETIKEIPEKETVSAGVIQNTVSNADIQAVSYDSPKPSFIQQWLGWGVAALACIALVVNIWLTRVDTPQEIAVNPTPTETPQKEPTTVEKKQQFLASANDVIKTDWASPDESQELNGEIVWSNNKQEGYMTFRGLPANEKDKETYQLWIFDEAQDEKTPIDGGVFDVNENGEVTIPIDAKINVKNPKMFAVTVEKPGGVVVSKREKIVALAKVEA